MSARNIVIREERPGDEQGVRRVNEEAFGQPDEADLVDRLRAACSDESLSFVALDGDTLVGFVLLTPARIGELKGMGLAPVAVLPSHQRDGIGGRLIRAGLDAVRAQGTPFVIVLGHAEYYPRFGFERASDHGIRCKWDVPEDVFMILRLDREAMGGVEGLAEYREEFG